MLDSLRLRNGHHMPGALDCPDVSPSNRVTPAVRAISCLGPGTRKHKLVVTHGLGIADPFVDDLSTGQGIVLGRAATKLRSIEIQPLTGGSTSHRLVDPRNRKKLFCEGLTLVETHSSWLLSKFADHGLS